MAKLQKAVTLVLVLRVAAAALCFCSAIVMVTSHQSTSFFGITMDARFEYTPAFKFLVAATTVVCAYSVILVFLPPAHSSSRFVVATDALAALLLTASLSAAGTVGYIGKEGSAHAGWMPVCGRIPRFCRQTTAAVACNFVAVLLYTIIVFYNILKPNSPLSDST